jgi:two-component system CheB/CheR fusion protein
MAPSLHFLATVTRVSTAMSHRFGLPRDATSGVEQARLRPFEPDFTDAVIDVTHPRRTLGISADYIEACRRSIAQSRLAPEPVLARSRNDEFLAVFSHEVRSALSAIHNAAHLLRMQHAETPMALKARLLIERQVSRMTRLVADLCDVARVRSDAPSLRRERVDLCVIAKHALDTLELDMSARNHRLEVSMPAAPVWLQGDAGRLEQVLVNLLSNAAKYTDPGGEVTLAVHQKGAQAIICVRDTGIGIAPHMLPRVFELYVQADPASRHVEAGLGIGLALVRNLVELHGGEVTAASAGLGHGSEFCVRLPLAPVITP